MNCIVGRNMLACCQFYSTNVDDVITKRFDVKNIDRVANYSVSDKFCNRVAKLSELIQFNVDMA